MAETSGFGAFFRKTRTGLGLTLRAFCYQNGFDPGNVSRIERGLAPPPKKDEGLEKYAKALKLKRGADPYNQFFALATTETGQISGELMGRQAAAEQLPKLLENLRGGSGHRNWVTARHLDEWGDTLAARAVLPQLVRRLIHATGKSLTSVSFPALEQTQRRGLDGVVDAGEPDAFVPVGRSVWEMGVSQRPATKAEEDFGKRRMQKLDFNKKAATYVFVTPRTWIGKDDFAAKKNKLRVWRQVRVYDSANLEEWLERAPAVDIWLARQLGIRPDGLSDINEYWESLAGVTEPPLDPRVFLASRVKEAEELESWLKGPPGVVALETRSPTEAIDFVAAVVRQAAERDAITARTVIVEEKKAWRSICLTDSQLNLVAHPDLTLDPESVAGAVQRGHRVILPVTQSVTDRVRTLKLPRVYRHDLQKALHESGVPWQDAADYASKAGGSLTVLKRVLANVRGTSAPEWSRPTEASALVPILLAGAWEGEHEGDKATIARLAGRPYQEVADVAARWLDTPDPPVKRIQSRWSLVSRDDSWYLMAHAVTSDRLRVFQQVAVEVLAEDDPVFDLPPDERWMANMKGKVLRHSQTLRAGVAETLALLGARPPASLDALGIAAQVVRQILESADWKRWASLYHHLALLAEAAPDVFLTAVEKDLRSTEPALRKLFNQDGSSPFFSSAPHAGLLWALEGIAWNRDKLARVSYALAQLDIMLGGKKTGNSPLASLIAIYLPWYPQTTSPIDERVTIIRKLCQRQPDTGWRLLIELLPDQVRHSTPIRRPAFRDWALSWTERMTNADYARQVVAYSELANEVAGVALTRLLDLVKHFENLAAPTGKKLLERLRTLDLATLTVPARRQLSDALREKITFHRRLKAADWALPDVVLGKLEEVQRHLEPHDAVSRNAWLFNQICEDIAYKEETGENEVMILREQAVKDIRAEAGWDGVIALARAVKKPDELGEVVGRAGTATDDEAVLPGLIESEEETLKNFARGYVWGRFDTTSWEWVAAREIGTWSPTAVADVALTLPNQPQAWAFAATGGTDAAREYWLKIAKTVSEPTAESVRDAVQKLLEYRRPFQACFILSMARHGKCEVAPELAAAALEAGLTGPLTEASAGELGDRRHSVLEMFKYLQEETSRTPPGIEQIRVARLEFGYIGLLDGYPASPTTLLSMLESDPTFFVDLLVATCPPSDEKAEDGQEPSEQDQAKAQGAFRLLRMWERVPGTGTNDTVDYDALLDWTRKARELAEEKKRLQDCDLRFGEVLAYAPKEPTDGARPCIAVRDLLEEIGSADLEEGFEVGVYNRRSAYNKAIDEGGEQERSLAKRYRDWAEVCHVDWPRTAASLSRIADGYEREAGHADTETELRFS